MNEVLINKLKTLEVRFSKIDGVIDDEANLKEMSFTTEELQRVNYLIGKLSSEDSNKDISKAKLSFVSKESFITSLENLNKTRILPDGMVYLRDNALEKKLTQNPEDTKYQLISEKASSLKENRLKYSRDARDGNKMSCMITLVHVKSDKTYKEIQSWDLLSGDYQISKDPKELKKQYDEIIEKTGINFTNESALRQNEFQTELDKLIQRIFDNQDFMRPQTPIEVKGAWGKVERTIDPSTFEGFKDYLVYNAEYEAGKRKFVYTWEDDCGQILAKFMQDRSDTKEEAKESIKRDFLAIIKPLQNNIRTLVESIEITNKELKETDRSLHTEAYMLSVDYQKLSQKITEAQILNSTSHSNSSDKIDQEDDYRIYIIISSSLGACHPCSLLVSTYPLEQIKKQGCKIPVTTFYIRDNLEHHSDKSSDHSGKWGIEYSDFGDEEAYSPKSWDKTLYTSMGQPTENRRPSEKMTVVSSSSAKSLLLDK
jgi:hypothetical protein